jgi:hypothetical protein
MATSVEMKNILISMDDSSLTAEFKETLQNLISFSLYDSESYRSYDNFTLTVACIFIACSHVHKDAKIYEEILKSLQCDRALVDDCISLVMRRLNDDSLEQVSQENFTSASMETKDTMCLAGDSFGTSSISRHSSCSDLYSFGQININYMMVCDEEVTGNIKFTSLSNISGKGRKKINFKLKTNKFNLKLKHKFKARKTRFFIEGRLRFSKIFKK